MFSNFFPGNYSTYVIKWENTVDRAWLAADDSMHAG